MFSCNLTQLTAQLISSQIRTALAAGLVIALAADCIFKSGFFPIVKVILRMRPPTSELCVSECYVHWKVLGWIVFSAISMIIQLYSAGAFVNMFSRGYRYHFLSTNAPKDPAKSSKVSTQKTFSYPDHLEFNFFDPDSIPESMQAYADAIFTIVQGMGKLYGFQVDNMRNQSEHFLMMLTNETLESDKYISAPATRLHSKLFVNYKKWCHHMNVQPKLLRDLNVNRSYEHLIEDIMMFLLIWGEAANLKHMPECLCLIYHKMMQLHHDKTSGSNATGAARFNGPALYPGFFLDMVVTPIFEVIQDASKATGDHSTRKHYDDLNEFFWSPTCLHYRIFHHAQDDSSVENGTGALPNVHDTETMLADGLRTCTKTYLEKRSWLHPLYSMHRIFEWHVITFTILLTWAFANQLQWTYAFAIQVGSIVFWQITSFGILWTCLEIWTVYPNVKVSDPSMYGFLVRILAGYMILIYQSVYLHWSFVTEPSDRLSHIGLLKRGDHTFWWWQYVWISLISSSLYLLQSILCWFPNVTSALMTWDNDIVQSFLSICYPFSQLYVGKKVHVPLKEVIVYIIFWLTLLGFKLWFGYRYIVFPVSVPSLLLYDDYVNFQQIHFMKTFSLMFVWWFPHFLVYIIDLSIWYSVWSSAVGGLTGLIERQGAVRTSKNFRKHFMRAHLAFCQKLMPSNSLVNQRSVNEHVSTASLTNLMMAGKSKVIEYLDSSTTSKIQGKPRGHSINRNAVSTNDFSSMSFSVGGGSVATAEVSSKDAESAQKSTSTRTLENMIDVLDVRSQRWVVFGKVWNEIIRKLREHDHINNLEMDLFLFTYFDWLTLPVYLPLYQTAGLVSYAANAFLEASESFQTETESVGKMKILEKFSSNLKIGTIDAVGEAWELAVWILRKVLGPNHLKDLDRLSVVLHSWVHSRDIFSRLNGSQVLKILDHLSNIVTSLKGSLAKRKKTPLVTAEYLLLHQESTRKGKNNQMVEGAEVSSSKNGGLIKKSVSTGFLAALNESEADSKSSPQANAVGSQAENKPFAKLQPFRKASTLMDNTRDKVRDEVRGLFLTLRSSLKMKDIAVTAEGQDLMDRITFILSLESGFIWSDVYASSQIDEFSQDYRSVQALNKLHGLLKLRITQVELKSAEAKRRLNSFLNSLFMDIPTVPSARYCKDYTCITPYYSEDIILSKSDLESRNSSGVTTLLYLQTLYKADWINFLERRGITDEQIWSAQHEMETRCWASLRAQTLYRTVVGMMQTESALKLLAELEMLSIPERELIGKLKFNYVVACQIYGQMKKTMDPKADDIEYLLSTYPNLRVAYIDSFRVNREGEMAYYSVLIKHNPAVPFPARDVKEVFRVKLPGLPVLGEGKPENQNHALIFSRGRYLQAIDMNQDGYFEEALKARNLLQEFDTGCTILGVKEHIFTGSVSSVANYMALQELSFVTLGQRVLNNPLRIRQHYGHPDFFNKIFVMTEGGMSKASRGIHLSEDVFAGYNCTIRGHTVSFKEYAQVGKGRDVGLQQTYKFEAKLSQGNAEQSLTRDLSRIGDRLDFFRLMSFYFGGIGHYLSNAMVMFTLMVVVYSMLTLAIFNEEGVNGRAVKPEGLLQMALAGMGLLQTLPLFVTLTVEKGFFPAFQEVGYMFLSGGPLYFIFHIQTKSYYFSHTLLAGGAKYRPTGRGFVTRHSPFDENFRFFAMSHMYIGFEIAAALTLLGLYTKSKQYAGLTWSLWLAAVAFLLGPFWFNPLSFEWDSITTDYTRWIAWMTDVGGTVDQSWEAWWRDENTFFKQMSISWRCFLFVMKCVPWIFIALGLLGSRFMGNPSEQRKLCYLLAVFLVYFFLTWILRKLERNLAYAVRRVLSIGLTVLVAGTIVSLYCAHTLYIKYTVALYYLLAAVAYLFLLLGAPGLVIYIYKMHDYILGNILFTVLGALTMIQVNLLTCYLPTLKFLVLLAWIFPDMVVVSQCTVLWS